MNPFVRVQMSLALFLFAHPGTERILSMVCFNLILQGFEETLNFCHPLEIIYACTGLGGWPKLYVELGFLDTHSRSDLSTNTSLPLPLSLYLFFPRSLFSLAAASSGFLPKIPCLNPYRLYLVSIPICQVS